ncbi:MAG: hypothetical protein DMG06_27200 [Acidobacteria bacterium]|nr:MAG: hypothetical protein DMG06_27200 [Acidobacteriota bacterium]
MCSPVQDKYRVSVAPASPDRQSRNYESFLILFSSISHNGPVQLDQSLDCGRQLDEYFFITFSNNPALDLDVTSISSDVEKASPSGLWAGRLHSILYDAVYLALEKMTRAHHQRKAIILVTDGKENNSR